MIKSKIIKKLYKNYTSKFIGKIFLAGLFSIIVAASTSATAWLLDPAIEKIFIKIINPKKLLLLNLSRQSIGKLVFKLFI